MPRFDPRLWKSRAAGRFDRSSDRLTGIRKLIIDIESIDALSTIVGWCSSRGINVVFNRQASGSLESTRKTISVNGRLDPERQVHVLLHECGHYLIGDRVPGQRFGHSASTAVTSLLHRIDVIDEELEAWHRGLQLARRLKIDVNPDRFNQTRAEYVKSYLDWASRARKKKKHVNETDHPQRRRSSADPLGDVPDGHPSDGKDRP